MYYQKMKKYVILFLVLMQKILHILQIKYKIILYKQLLFAVRQATDFVFVCMSKTEDMRMLATQMQETLGSKGGGKTDAIQGRTEAKKADLQAFWEQKGFTIYQE